MSKQYKTHTFRCLCGMATIEKKIDHDRVKEYVQSKLNYRARIIDYMMLGEERFPPTPCYFEEITIIENNKLVRK
jgi:hypothetical protein